MSTFKKTVTVPSGRFAVEAFSLAELHAKAPRGPLDVDVTFVAPAFSGLRQTQRIVYKSPLSTGLVWDFETMDEYTRYGLLLRGHAPQFQRQEEPIAPVAGGPKGSSRALRMELQQPPEENIKTAPNRHRHLPESDAAANVLLHPALPGVVARIRMQVKCEGAPIDFAPVLIDKGVTGVSNKRANHFWLPRQRIDWQEWREVEFIAPPPPPDYQNKKKDFLRQPVYPLNLLLRAKAAPGAQAALWVDDIRVVTHLPAAEELQARVLFPNATRMHAPGVPLELALNNFAAAPAAVEATWELRTFQDALVAKDTLKATVPAAHKQRATLLDAMTPGIYRLEATGLPGKNLQELLYVLDAKRYFGSDPLAFLKQVPAIRKSIGLTTEAVRLDWDNTEPVPGLFHHHWFDAVCAERTADGQYAVEPVLGFSADWAGIEAQESLAQGSYVRYMPNYLQLPARLVDWSRFVRTVVRKRAGQYDRWVFWENPDLEHGSQFIPPARYREMLGAFHKWVSLYDPEAAVVAGGFNMDAALEYLDRIQEPSSLPFDEIALRMNLGELSPEAGDIEGFLDALNDILALQKTERSVRITSLDWGIGPYVTPAEQAAYHVRAALMLDSRGAQMHRFACINKAQSFEGYGVFYRTKYGNSNLQNFRTVHVPKPSYFAIAHVQRFLEEWRFVKEVRLPDARPGANRAYLYQDKAGTLTLVTWRAAEAPRAYRLPDAWQTIRAQDAFGLPVRLERELVCSGFPSFVRMPAEYELDQLVHDVRMMQPANGKDAVILDLHVAEPASRARAAYEATGAAEPFARVSQVPGDRRRRDVFVGGLETERFSFALETAGNALLTRRWYLNEGQRLWVSLNGDDEQVWDLRPSKALQEAFQNPDLYAPGARESTFVLQDCRAGRNTVAIRYAAPGNASSYRVEPLAEDTVPLVRWAPLNVLQTKGELRRFRSVQDTLLRIGKTRYDKGLGTHAVALLEFPLDRRFARFEVTVGIDTATEGRGTVVFEIHADGERKATSGLMNGFTPAKTLEVEDLADTRRLLLIVKDGGDGNRDDFANWVNGTLELHHGN